MRWITRVAVFVLSVSLGASTWYILAQKKPAPIQLNANVEETPTEESKISETPAEQQDAPEQTIKFAPVGRMSGYINTDTVILREGPEASARVVARLKMGEYYSAEILGATRDYLHVRFGPNPNLDDSEKRDREYEGWAKWGSVMPSTSAIILDAETGAVVSRLPINNGFTSVAYSPDGERAIFYGGQDDSTIACEVRTSDYTPTRSLVSTLPGSDSAFFYGPSDGAIYAVVLSRGPDNVTTPTKLSVVRIGEEGSPNTGAEISAEAEDFAVAPDGFTGFILHSADSQRHEMTVDVVDLRTFKVRNSFTLQGTNLPQVASVFVLNRDGTELYARLDETASAVSVVDTRTGQLVRLLSFDSKAKDYWFFDRGDVVGDSLLLRVWNQDEDEMHTPAHAMWLGSGGRVTTENGISYAVQTNDARYAINESGTRLLKLDSNNHVRVRQIIERPELPKGKENDTGLSIFSLSASPDGKRLILIVGIEDGC